MLIIRECCDEARGPLAKALPGSKVEGNTVSVKVAGGEIMDSIGKAVDVLSAGHYSYKELFVKKPTMDDVFLNVTGEKLMEGGM